MDDGAIIYELENRIDELEGSLAKQRAVLADTREPFPAMIEAGARAITLARRNHWNHELQAKVCFQAMHDVLMNKEKENE
jgi:hypothetical protein